MAAVKTLLSTLAAALALLTAGVHPAAAAQPCWKAVLNDWVENNGVIHGTYPTSCYQEAIRHVPPDTAIYSSAIDDIRRAMLLAFHTRDNGPGGGPGGGNGTIKLDERSFQVSSEPHHRHGVIGRAIDWLGPDNAESVPLPLIILGAIGLLLLAAGGAGYAARRIQARRLGLPVSGPPTPPET
jgi:hypothetical protein